MNLQKNTLFFGLMATALLLSACGGGDETPQPAPSITSFTPSSGETGATVTISGNNFSATAAENQVKFGAIAATVSAASPTSITTSVPAGASTGKISVTVNGQTATSAADFTVNLAPSINSFSPTSGTGGATITINGTNFSTTASQNIVKFNGATATVTAATATSLTVTLPNDATTGKITVQVGSLTATSTTDFSAIISITNFTPTSGTSTTSITVTGTNFPSANVSVQINNFSVIPTSVSATSITFLIPSGASTGKISILAPGQNVSTASNLIVIPIILNYLPTAGGIGETININGTGFSSVAANNVVRFNGVSATVVSASASGLGTSLTVTVPSGATTGKISLQVSGGSPVMSSGDFIVLTGSWVAKANFAGSARIGAVGFSIGSKGYFGTGRTESNVPVKEFWEYDPATNTWSQKADFAGTARYNAVGFSIGTKGYIGTGDDGAPTPNLRNDFWEYDPSTNTWTARANFGGTARNNAAAFSIGTKGYVGTGIDNLTTFARRNDFWEYDPSTNVWTQRANLTVAGRSQARSFSIGNSGYIVGGELSLALQDTWEYNPTANTWTQKANHPSSINSQTASSFAIGTKGYVCTGNTSRTCFEYNPATNTWTQVANLASDARNRATAFAIGSKGYLGTGAVLSTFYNSFLEFTP